MRAVRLFDRLIDGLAVLAACILFAITFLIAFDALTRQIPFAPRLNGVIELTEYALYIVTVLASPWALRLGAHIMVEIVTDSLSPKGKSVAAILVNLIGLIVSATLIYAGSLATWKAWMAGTLVFKSFIFPQFWLLLPLPIGALLLLIEFLLRLFGIRGRTPPTLKHQIQEG
jgi:TRAP-type C4-dicarboxylate transport system permease small subunit